MELIFYLCIFLFMEACLPLSWSEHIMNFLVVKSIKALFHCYLYTSPYIIPYHPPIQKHASKVVYQGTLKSAEKVLHSYYFYRLNCTTIIMVPFLTIYNTIQSYHSWLYIRSKQYLEYNTIADLPVTTHLGDERTTLRYSWHRLLLHHEPKSKWY